MDALLRRVAFVSMIGLALWVGGTSVVIERMNTAAGGYLPRRDGEADGKWRSSRQDTPRDRLRRVVASLGLLQYVLAPILIALASASTLQTNGRKRLAAVASTLVGLCALTLAIYRGYAASLGS